VPPPLGTIRLYARTGEPGRANFFGNWPPVMANGLNEAQWAIPELNLSYLYGFNLFYYQQYFGRSSSLKKIQKCIAIRIQAKVAIGMRLNYPNILRL